MAAHRYWRMRGLCRQQFGSYVFALAEMECRTAPGGPNLCTGGTPLAPQASDFGWDIGNAFDANAATGYSRGGNSFISPGYDFGAAVDVGEVRLRFLGAASGRPGSTHSPSVTVIEWSDDGTVWRTMAPSLDLTDVGDDGEAAFVLVAPGARLGGRTPRLAPGVPVVQARSLGGLARYDTADGGAYRVAGTVKIDGTPATPVRRRVRLFDVTSGRLVRQVWSAADGSFAFERIRGGEYIVVSDDHTRTYNAVAADRVLAVP